MRNLRIIFTILGLLYSIIALYNFRKANYLQETQTVVNIYPDLPDEKVDAFFNLPKGTFDNKKHRILYSFVNAKYAPLNYYRNLPVYPYDSLKKVDCEESFSARKHSRFNRSDIVGNGVLYVRLTKDLSNFNTNENSKSILAVTPIAVNITFGKINNILINTDGATPYCK